MHRAHHALACLVTLTLLQACATAHVKVKQEAGAVTTRFSRVAVPPFENGVGASLPSTVPESMAGAVIAKIQQLDPPVFREVGSQPTGQPGELVVKGKIASYDPGSKAARFILIGLGAGDLELDVLLVDGAGGATLEQFSTDGAIVAGGIAGATMGPEDMIESAAEKVAERVAKFGAPGG